MSNLDDLFDKHKTAFSYEDMPHSRKKLSKYFGMSWMDAIRSNSFTRSTNGDIRRKDLKG